MVEAAGMVVSKARKPRYGTPASIKAYYVGVQPASTGRTLKGAEFEKRKRELEAQQQTTKTVKAKPNF